jgi:hypothetical protein
MISLDNLLATVQREIAEYVRPSPTATAYYVENPAENTFAVLSVPNAEPQRAAVVILVRVVDNLVLIESDKTNKPLYEALLQAGIARDQIVLVYEGEHRSAA